MPNKEKKLFPNSRHRAYSNDKATITLEGGLAYNTVKFDLERNPSDLMPVNVSGNAQPIGYKFGGDVEITIGDNFINYGGLDFEFNKSKTTLENTLTMTNHTMEIKTGSVRLNAGHSFIKRNSMTQVGGHLGIQNNIILGDIDFPNARSVVDNGTRTLLGKSNTFEVGGHVKTEKKIPNSDLSIGAEASYSYLPSSNPEEKPANQHIVSGEVNATMALFKRNKVGVFARAEIGQGAQGAKTEITNQRQFTVGAKVGF